MNRKDPAPEQSRRWVFIDRLPNHGWLPNARAGPDPGHDRDPESQMRQVPNRYIPSVGMAALGLGVALLIGVSHEATAQSREIEMDKKQSHQMTLAIRDGGLPCPLAKKAFVTRVDQVATEVRVHCGPFTGPGLTNNQVYRVTFLTDGSSYIKPWAASKWPRQPTGR